MANVKRYSITVSVQDMDTKIELFTHTCEVKSRVCPVRASYYATQEAKDYVLKNLSFKYWSNRFGLSQAQFESMCAAHVIDPLFCWDFEVVQINCIEE